MPPPSVEGYPNDHRVEAKRQIESHQPDPDLGTIEVRSPPRPCEKKIAAIHWAIYCRCTDSRIAKTSDEPF